MTMKMYPKELHSLKAIEQEKKKLRRQLRKIEDEDLFSFGNKSNKKSGSDEASSEGFDMSSLLGMLPISNPFIATLLPILQKRLFKTIEQKISGEKSQVKETVAQQVVHAEPGVMNKVKTAAGNIGKEVIMGYLKWKAIELTYKGVRQIIKAQKAKRKATTM